MDPGWDTVHHQEVRGTPSEFVVVYCYYVIVLFIIVFVIVLFIIVFVIVLFMIVFFFVIVSTGCCCLFVKVTMFLL